jgi:hypothetical protein
MDIKYLKYKNKYLNLKNQLGGECDPLPENMNDQESISLDEYITRNPDDRITIDKFCYFVEEIFKWVIKGNNNILPHRVPISPADRQRIINAYNALHPDAPHVDAPHVVAPHVDSVWGPIPIFPGIITHGDEGNVLNITSGVTHINNEEYANRSLGKVIIPDSVTHIGNNAFANNLISELRIPSSVTHIGDNAFANNQFLSRVIIPRILVLTTQSKKRIFGDIPLNRTNFTYLD